MAALNAGETVLVHNAGGGVGIAATQLARLRRATVIGTASAFKHDALRTFGVDHAIDYRHANVAEEIRKITRGRGVDVILDPIGGRSFTDQLPDARAARSARDLRAVGRRNWRATELRGMPCTAWMATPRFNPLSLINRNRGVFGLHIGHLWEERRQLAPLMEMLLSELTAGRFGAGRGANVLARSRRRRAPVHSEPGKYRQSRADCLS